MHQPDLHPTAPFCDVDQLASMGSAETAAHTYGFEPLIPANPAAPEPADAREARLAGLAKLRAKILHRQLRHDLPKYANLRTGGMLPDDRSRMGAVVVFCLVLAGLSVAVRFAGWL